MSSVLYVCTEIDRYRFFFQIFVINTMNFVRCKNASFPQYQVLYFSFKNLVFISSYWLIISMEWLGTVTTVLLLKGHLLQEGTHFSTYSV